MDELINTGETPQEQLQPKRGLRWFFIGQNGLRAGWGALAFLLLTVLFIFVGILAISMLHKPGHHHDTPVEPGFALIAELVQYAGVLLATAIMALSEKKKLAAYGYAGSARTLRFLSGIVWGFIALSVLVGALWKAHLLAFDGSILSGPAVWKYAAEWGLVFLLTGLFEESLLRGYLQFTLTRGIGFWWTALLLSALFGLIHKNNSGESPVGLFSAAAIGLVFCISLWYTGSLWWAIGFHAAWDWGETFFYGTADSGMVPAGHLLSSHPTGALLWSGGATGPEGSLFVVPLILLIALLMWLWWGRRTVSPFKTQIM